MKKTVVFVVFCIMIITLTACVGSVQENQTNPPVSEMSADTDAMSAASGPGEESATTDLGVKSAKEPILLTSGGQSADFQMVSAVLRNLEKEHIINELAEPEDLSGYSTLIVVVGGSSKGLGAAGIDAAEEIARLTRLLDAATAHDMYIITMHTGGEARRGDLSDRFITPVFAYGDHAIAVASGDADGYISGITAANAIPMDIVEAFTDIVPVLKGLFS